jgi:hypothetical protein
MVSVDGPGNTVTAPAVPDARRDRVPERPFARALWAVGVLLALAAVVLGVLPEGATFAELRAMVTGEEPTGANDPRALSYLEDLERQPVDSLPGRIMEFETTVLQTVPATPQAAEAMYMPVDMKLTIETPVRIYTNVEAFPDAAAAATRAAELMDEYPVARRSELLGGVTLAEVGMKADDSALIVAWTRGQFCIFTKAVFDRVPPNDGSAERRLSSQGVYIAHAVELFQRTGEQGAGAREMIQKLGITHVIESDGL